MLIALKWVKSFRRYNVICKDERECRRKTERSLKMIYGETLRIINKPMFSIEISFKKGGMIYVQRSALGEGGESLNVELQANTVYSIYGRRKILAL